MNDRNNGCDEVQTEVAPGVYRPSQPLRPTGRTRRFIERRCRHHYHARGFIEWFCCNCGKEHDGYPEDGYDRSLVARVARWFTGEDT
jgi:hypothetical protein